MKRVDRWQGDDGKIYDCEFEALKADARFWKNKHEESEQRRRDSYDGPKSGYGSSGGGGHD